MIIDTETDIFLKNRIKNNSKFSEEIIYSTTLYEDFK